MFGSEIKYGDFLIRTDLIFPYEFFLAPLYLLLVYIFAYIIRNRYYLKSPLKKYFIPALTVKIVGAISLCLIYNYYYQGGDTSNYFIGGKILSTVLVNHPLDGIQILFSSAQSMDHNLRPYFSYYEYANAENTFMVVKFCALVQLFTFQSYLITSIIFGFISFWPIWAIFRLFCSYFPALIPQFAFAFLFTPSVFFWGSGILKDTVCLAALAYFFCCIDGFFFKGKKKMQNAAGMLFCGLIIGVVKIYIIMSFALCIVILVFLHYRSRIRSRDLQLFVTPIIIFGAFLLGIFLIKTIADTSFSKRYSFEQILETSKITREYIYSSGASSYSLGEIDNSVWGLIKIIPSGVNVTLFRPYPWEAHNVIAILASLESCMLLILTLSTIFKTGIFRFFKTILETNLIFFCITFAIIFAFFVGITTYNFGSLVRYKIPCIPFYISAIFMIEYVVKQKRVQKKSAYVLSRQGQTMATNIALDNRSFTDRLEGK